MYVKQTYIPVRRRKRRKRFPVAMIEDEMNSSFYLFSAFNADSIKKYKADQKCNPKKKEKPKKLQSSVHFDATPVDLKTVKENRKKNKKRETKKKDGVAAAQKYKFFKPEVKTLSDVTFSPNTTFDRLLHSSRKPLADKNSVVYANQVNCINSALLSPSHCLSVDKGGNRTSTPILISPIFPAVTVRNKQRSKVLKRGGRNSLLTPVLRNSIESVERSSQLASSVLAASVSNFSPSPLLCNGDDTGVPIVVEFLESDAPDELECLCNKIVEVNKCEGSFCSPVAARTRSSTENEKIYYKITQAQDASQNVSGITMRLRRTAASENGGLSNTDSTFNPDESFFSSIKVRHKRNKKTENRFNKFESAGSSDDFLSPVFTQSKKTSKIAGLHEKTVGVREFVSARNSDERSGSDNVCDKSKSNCYIDESIPSSVKVKHKRIKNRLHIHCSNQNRERHSSPLGKSSEQNESGSDSVSTTCDVPKCAQLQFATTCESPDMFADVDEIETDMIPSKFITVVEKYNMNISTCNSNDKDASNRNVSSGSVITDYSHGYHESCISNGTHSFKEHVRKTELSHSVSSIEIKDKSDVVRKSISNTINLSSQISSMLDLTSSVPVGHSDSVNASVQSSDCDNIANELCAGGNKSLETEFDIGGSFKATANEFSMSDAPEVNQCSRSIRKSARSSFGAAAILSAPSHTEICIPSHREMCTANMLSQAHQEEESENLSSVPYRASDSHKFYYCKGQSLTHNMSVYCEENTEKSHCNRSRRSNLCRRLSHVVIPERRTRGSSNSNESLSVSYKKAVALSVSVIIEDDELIPEADITLTQGLDSARDMVLGRCNQSEHLTFDKAFPPRFFDNCKKIGEGLYGEVFFCQYNSAPGRVLKIIPIEGDILVNGEKQKKYNEVLSELVIAAELSNLRHDSQFTTSCFVEVARCMCVQGKYPQRLIDLWNEYHEEKVSENDSPTIFDDSQLFLIFELADGGKALETYCFTSAAQAFSAFVQLTFALAVAEITLEFEHRDLHWGNVLINKTSVKHITFKLNGQEFLVPANGVQVTIIDYTLSRMSYGGCCIFNDLAVDPDLFISQGDYQFEVYRLMQNTVKNEWNHFRPYTNILWLHYILGKMLQGVHYKNVSTKIHKKFKAKLTNCHNDIRKYHSAYELVTSGNLLEMIK